MLRGRRVNTALWDPRGRSEIQETRAPRADKDLQGLMGFLDLQGTC